jgi:hypothetical protein
MDSRVKSRVAAYGDPAAQQGAAGTGAGAGSGAGTSGGYSASLGNIGMGDEPGAAGGSGNGHDDGHSPAAAFKEAASRFGELKEFASYYVGAKLDGIKITVRNVGIYAALGIVGLIAASAIITTAVVLLLGGLAFAIGAIFEPDRPWVGAIVVGLLVLGGLAGGIIFGMKKLTNTFRKQLVQKYENRQRDQRINFGEDVRGRREEASGRSA